MAFKWRSSMGFIIQRQWKSGLLWLIKWIQDGGEGRGVDVAVAPMDVVSAYGNYGVSGRPEPRVSGMH